MDWIEIYDGNPFPNEGEFVLCKFDHDFIGISRFIDGEWDTGPIQRRRTIYKGSEIQFTSCDPKYWKKLN